MAVLVFMLVYYRFAGLVACVALLANLLLTVAFMVLVQATFTLPGLAGLVLMLGMAVDANVLIYERLREERERGASLALAIRNGYDRAFPTIIDTHLIEHLHRHRAVRRRQRSAQGLRHQPDGRPDHQPVHVAVHDARPCSTSGWRKNWLHKLSMMQLFQAAEHRLHGHPLLHGSRPRSCLTVVGAALFIYRLVNGGLNIDFVGGTAYGGQLVQAGGIDRAARTAPATADAGGHAEAQGRRRPARPSIEQIFVPELTQGDKTHLFTVRTSEKNANLVQEIVNYKLGAEWGNTSATRTIRATCSSAS